MLFLRKDGSSERVSTFLLRTLLRILKNVPKCSNLGQPPARVRNV